MPFIGQDVYKNAARENLSRTANTMRAVRSGQYGAIPPNKDASLRAREMSSKRTQQIRSGQYFGNNVSEKQAKNDQRTIQRFMQSKSQIENR